MKNSIVIFLLLLSCMQTHTSPHTKKGQAKIYFDKVHTPYYIQYLTLEGVVPFQIKWKGLVKHIIIEVQYIIRPTSPRRRFPLYQENLSGNYYTVYRDSFKPYNINEFDGNFSVFNKGDYRLKVTLVNDYWKQTRYSNFKVY